MGCNCGNQTTAHIGNRAVAVNTGFDQARQLIKQRGVMSAKPTKKYCPSCRSYGVKSSAIVVKCPLCGTTFSAA